MESEEIRQLEDELSKAVSYKERSAIRTKLRVLKKGGNAGRATNTTVSPTQQDIENESTMRPKSTVITNGYGSNSTTVDPGLNRKSMEESSMANFLRSGKSSQVSRDLNSTESLPIDKSNGNSFTPKRHSYQPTTFANRGNISNSKTPPSKRKETADSIETRGRSRTIDSALGGDTGPEAITIRTLSKQQIQFCLTQYLNRELRPKRKIVPTGESLYLVCADPRILCRLVNVSKKNTIDMRCLTEISDTASDIQIKIAVEENMTLAVESARAIGCHITDEDVLKIIHHDPDTIHKILLKFLQARVIDHGGMEDMPSSYFTQPSFLFEQLNIDIPTDSTATSLVAEAPQSVSSKITSNNERKTETKRSSDLQSLRNTSNQESTVRSNASGPKIRRVSSDRPSEVKDKTEIKPIGRNKQSSDVKGLAASFEKNKGEPVTRQLSAGVPTRFEPVHNGSSPSNAVRSHREVVFTKSSDFKLSKSDTLTEENIARADPPIEPSSGNRALYTPPKKHSSLEAGTETADKPDSKIKEANKPDSQIKEANKEPDKSAVTESPQKTIELTSDPLPVPKLEEEPTPKLAIDLSLVLTDSPIVSPLNSNDTITPVSTKTTDSDNANLDSDEYLLTLQETDPNLTYEQRKRIRKLKRMRKQNQPKK